MADWKLEIMKQVKEELFSESRHYWNCYSLGTGPPIRMETFVLNRKRLVDILRNTNGLSFVLLEGEKMTATEREMITEPFCQEEFFYWTFGVLEPNFFGLIDVLNEKTYLFYPQDFCDYMFLESGSPTTEEFVKEKFMIEFAVPLDELVKTFKILDCKDVLVLSGLSAGRRTAFKFSPPSELEKYSFDYVTLYPVISGLRAVKTKGEIEAIRFASKIICGALEFLIDSVVPGMCEHKLISLFSDYVQRKGGCRPFMFKTVCISSSNVNRYLHFARNLSWDNEIKEGELCVFDLSCSYICYHSTVSMTFPISGTFTSDQARLYKVVNDIRLALFDKIEIGVSIRSINRLAEKMLLTKLKFDLDLLNKTVSDLLFAGIGKVFMPVPACHLIGLDHQDPGHGDEPNSPTSKGQQTDMALSEGMVLVLGPGCYFMQELIEPARTDGFVRDSVTGYLRLGAVRLKDLVLVTDSGYELLTAGVPRETGEVEDYLCNAKRTQLAYTNYLKPAIHTPRNSAQLQRTSNRSLSSFRNNNKSTNE